MQRYLPHFKFKRIFNPTNKETLRSIDSFNKRINELLFVQSCPCSPCNEMVNLKLKCFVHYGDFLIKKLEPLKKSQVKM